MKKTTGNLMRTLKSDNYSLDNYLEKSSASFIYPDIKEFWFALIEKSNYSKSDIINKSEFNYRYFYDVINGRKIPTRDKVIRLSLAMKLGIDDCQKALQLSGKAQLYPKVRRDSIILYSLKNKWPIVKCNRALIKYGEGELKMTENNNELLSYIQSSLESQYETFANLRQSEVSCVTAYRHRKSGQKLIVRKSKNRNDEVYRALKGKQNEHLPMIYEVCSADDSLIILEEYIEGKTLLELLSENTLDIKTARNYAKQLTEALIFLHGNEIIHRDIKPSNVIIKSDGTVVLIDLGIARMTTDIQEKDTQMLGTVGFAAPEQFGLSQSRSSTDIYSLGILLNIMLTGAYPSNKMAKGRVGKIIQKATSLQIAKRYQSAEQLLKALKRL